MKTLLPLPSVPKADQRVVRASWAHWPSRTMEVEELSTTGLSGQSLWASVRVSQDDWCWSAAKRTTRLRPVPEAGGGAFVPWSVRCCACCSRSGVRWCQVLSPMVSRPSPLPTSSPWA